MAETINLVKLCVGCDSPDLLEAWHAARSGGDPDWRSRHVTRMWPKRAAELLNGGSLYWVFKGVVLARQQILALDEVIGEDGIRRCGLRLDRPLIRTHAAPRRPFQGWRYLTTEDAPRDLPRTKTGEEPLPAELSAALSEIGVI